jgi:hypothetical protein
MSYRRRSPQPEPVKQPATPQQLATATLRAVRDLAQQHGDEALRDVMQVAIVRALATGIPTDQVQALTGHTAAQIERIVASVKP